ncbi:MAG: TetR/AcrR family transcriptional regulator [Brooklawnia sp.]|jgi:AcrR family transcriptional regulator
MVKVKTPGSSRREQAEKSRRKVLRAAREAFLESGYHSTTMGQIAKRAGLAVQTVSYHFGTKPRLMSELITVSVKHAMGEVAPLDRPAWEQALETATDGHELVDAILEEVHAIMMSVAQLMDVARIGGLTDPEVQEVYESHEQWRARDFGRFVGALDDLDALREGMDVQTALDIVLTVLGPDTYRMLSVDRGWDEAKIMEWMRQTIKMLLLRPTSG